VSITYACTGNKGPQEADVVLGCLGGC